MGLEATGAQMSRYILVGFFFHFIGVNYGNADFFFMPIFQIADIMLISNVLEVLKGKIVLRTKSL